MLATYGLASLGHEARPVALDALWRRTAPGGMLALVESATAEGFAAILAAVGAGAFADIEEACRKTITEVDRTEPGPNASVLAARHGIYERLYPALKPLFPAIAEDV